MGVEEGGTAGFPLIATYCDKFLTRPSTRAEKRIFCRWQSDRPHGQIPGQHKKFPNLKKNTWQRARGIIKKTALAHAWTLTSSFICQWKGSGGKKIKASFCCFFLGAAKYRAVQSNLLLAGVGWGGLGESREVRGRVWRVGGTGFWVIIYSFMS